MRCRMRTDRYEGNLIRYWLPECIGGAVYGRLGCTCPSKTDNNDIEDRVVVLEKKVRKLCAELRSEV